MRTTLTLDDDVADKLKREAERRGVSFKYIVNDALRSGLAAREGSVASKRAFRVPVFGSPFCRGIDPMKLNELADELDVEHEMGRLERSTAKGRS
jgi:hypothetical protein